MATEQQPTDGSQSTDVNSLENAGKPRLHGRPWLAFLALILALGSILTQFWQGTRQDSPDLTAALTRMQSNLQAQQAETRSIEAAIDDLAARLESVENRNTPEIPPDYSAEIAALQQEISRLGRQLGAMQSRLLSQAAVTQSNNTHLQKAEVEYLLRLGNERVQLFADHEAAMATLQLADRQLSAMDDPLMLSVRRALQQDIQALATVNVPDPLSILAIIEKLESGLADWPLVQMATVAETVPQAQDDGLWNRVKNSLKSLVTISRQEHPVLTLEEIDWLQERIRAQFQAARIAALNRDQDMFNSALQNVLQWQAQHYQADDPGNIEVRRSLQDLLATELAPRLPDITRALREIQLIGGVLNSTQAPPPASQPVTPSEPDSSPPADGQAAETGVPPTDSNQ